MIFSGKILAKLKFQTKINPNIQAIQAIQAIFSLKSDNVGESFKIEQYVNTDSTS